MDILEWVKLSLLILLGIFSSYSDLKTGIIRNKLILIFSIVAVILDVYYFWFLARDIIFLTAGNILSSVIFGWFLYWTHSFAGGDLKLICVMSLLYPTGAYLTYGTSPVTLFLAIMFAVIWGYAYLLATALIAIWKGNAAFNRYYVNSYLSFYAKAYLIAMAYISLLYMIMGLIDCNVIHIPSWIIWIAGFVIALQSSRSELLKSRFLIACAVIITIVLAINHNRFPLSKDPGTYLFTAALVFCQMAIKTNLYKTVPTSEIKKGMILSFASSAAMQGSKVKGLPGISSEDLRDRLTMEQAESIKRWGNTRKGLKDLVIVRKIPFAIFITLGFLSYFAVWSVLQ